MYSLVDIAPTIADILHISMQKRDGAAIPQVIKELDKCGKLILIIVDGFGLSIYESYKHYFNFRGMVFKCRGVSMHTAPAIAIILTGLHLKSTEYLKRRILTNQKVSLLLSWRACRELDPRS